MRWTHSWDDKRYGVTIVLAPTDKVRALPCGGSTLVELLDNWRSRRANRIHARWLGVAGLVGLIALCGHDRFPRVHLRRYRRGRWESLLRFCPSAGRLHFGSEPRRAQLRDRIWQQSATQSPPSRFPRISTTYDRRPAYESSYSLRSSCRRSHFSGRFILRGRTCELPGQRSCLGL